MKLRLQAALVLFYLASDRRLFAQANHDAALTQQGFSGVINTPDAYVQEQGTVGVLYSNQKDDLVGDPVREDNYLFSLGMFNVGELGARLAGNAKDLSLNFKLSSAAFTSRLPFSPAIAGGLQDAAGGVSYFRTKYVVGSVDPVGWVRLSGGYGTGPDRMNGAFGGVELRAQSWVTLLGDYDATKPSLGMRVATPALPYIPVRVTGTISGPLQHAQGIVFGGGLIIPLDFKTARRNEPAQPASHTLWGAITAKKARPTPSAPAASPAAVGSSPAPAVVRAQPPAAPAPASTAINASVEAGAALEALRDRLTKDGFVNVRVGLEGNTLVVVYENIRYNHSELDAIGVVAGLASHAEATNAEQVRIVVKRRGLALLQIESQLAPLRNWLEGDTRTQAPSLNVTQNLTQETAIRVATGSSNPSWLKPSIMVYPALTTFIGTEYGLFDYQLSIRPELQVPLWAGATAVARADVPVAWSGNLDPGKIYAAYQTPARMDRAMIFQAINIAPGLVMNLGAGRILTTTNGMDNELSWTPGGGRNRIKVIQSWGKDGDATRTVALGAYRLLLARHDLAFEATAGRFYGQDTGFLLNMQQFFGDTSLSLYFKDTVTPEDQKRWLQAGIQFQIPLTPRRDMKAKPIQIRGNEAWTYAQETGLASSSNQNLNYVKPGLATVPETSQSLDLFFYDRERLNRDYIVSHTARIKDAWLAFRNHL